MKIRHILVPTDFSAGANEAVRYAVDMARTLGATLHLMHVLENPFAPGAFMEMYTAPPPEYFVDVERQAEDRLRASVAPHDRSQVPVFTETRIGVPATEILARLEEEPKIDLLVMATHGRGGVARLVMGSVTDRVIRSADCPVLSIRQHPVPVKMLPEVHPEAAHV